MWNFYNPVRLHVGAEWLPQLTALLGTFRPGKPSVGIVTYEVFTTLPESPLRVVISHLQDVPYTVFAEVEPEPSHATIMKGKAWAEAHNLTAIIAIGGGSVIDAAKAICCLAATDLDITPIMDRQIVVANKTVPLLAIPTTAGTGSEVTPFCVLTNQATSLKKSLGSPYFYPDLALLVPQFVATLPQQVIADVGMDVLAHAFEAIWSVKSQPIAENLAFAAIRLVNENFIAYYRQPDNLAAASNMLQAASIAGMAFSNTFTAACHALSFPIGQRFHLSHGASCALTLHLIAQVNLAAVKPVFDRLARMLGLADGSEIPAFIEQIDRHVHTRRTFRQLGGTTDDLTTIARGAFQPLLANNPVALDEAQLVHLLTNIL